MYDATKLLSRVHEANSRLVPGREFVMLRRIASALRDVRDVYDADPDAFGEIVDPDGEVTTQYSELLAAGAAYAAALDAEGVSVPTLPDPLPELPAPEPEPA